MHWILSVMLMAANVDAINVATHYSSKELCFSRLAMLAEVFHAQQIDYHIGVGNPNLGLYAECRRVDANGSPFPNTDDPIRGQ